MTATARRPVLSTEAEMAVLPTWPEVLTRVPVRSAYVRIAHQLPVVAHDPLLWVRTPVRLGVTQQTQLPRIALVYPDCANRARYQAVTPAVCRSAGWYSFADSGSGPMPAVVRALLRDWETVTGSSTSPSSWLVIMSGTVPAAF